MNLAAVDPAHARDAAREILDGRRYKSSPVPRPLHGVLRWIGDRFASIAHWIGDRFSWLPGSRDFWGYGVAFAIVGLLTIFVVRALVRAQARSRAARLGADADGRSGASIEDAAALELAATEAEARGDLALALRLRFRAGLLRLDRDAHAIKYRPSIPTSEVRAELSSPTFDGIADTFESVTYGGTDAEPDDTAEAKRAWPRVLQAARRR